jgi:hypothetical protein
MSPNDNAINEFKKLYLQEYKISLTDQQSIEYSTRLVRLVKTVYEDDLPLPEKNIDKGANKNDN